MNYLLVVTIFSLVIYMFSELFKFFRFLVQMSNLYYWFGVGEGTLPLHHLTAQNTPYTYYPP
jgi:hypothetical protein